MATIFEWKGNLRIARVIHQDPRNDDSLRLQQPVQNPVCDNTNNLFYRLAHTTTVYPADYIKASIFKEKNGANVSIFPVMPIIGVHQPKIS